MRYEVVDTIIPQDKRNEINDKILHMIDHRLCEQHGISNQDIFNAYTGDGGLHGQQFSDFDNYHQYSEAKKEIEQGQFFTPHLLCKFLIECIQPTSFDMIADLTAGTGNFFNWLPHLHNVYGNEIDIKAYKVMKLLYPEVHSTAQDILHYKSQVRFDIILGNPPFNLNWRVDREEYISQLYYCMKAHDLLKPAGLLALIVPTSFMSDEFSDGGIIKQMNERFHFIYQSEIPQDSFKQMGVSNFPTKVMFFQKKSNHLSILQTYQADLERVHINSQTAQSIFKNYIEPVVIEKEKIKSRLFFENLQDNNEAQKIQEQIKKYLFDIKRNPKINKHYATALELVNRFMTEVIPDGMKYDEWEATRIKEKDVLSHLKKVLKDQHIIERDEIKLVKTAYGLKLKAYSKKMNTYLDRLSHKKSAYFHEMILNQEYDFEDPQYMKCVDRKKKRYELQSTKFEDLAVDPNIELFLKQFSLMDPYEQDVIHLNALQLKDTNLLLQKQYGYLQWEQGSGKTVSAIAQMLYRMKYNNVRNVYVVSTAIAINNTWETFLNYNDINYRRIRSIADIQQIRKGEMVLVTLDLLCKLKRFIKKHVKLQSKKLMLVFDEADAMSNPSSKRTKAVLSCFRKLPYKVLLSGTMTRNTIAEAFPQIELLYNNSVNMLSESEFIYKRNKEDPDKLNKFYNPFFMSPIPAYTEGYTLFSQSHIPVRITVFGVGQLSQDIYNPDVLKNLIDKTILTRTFEEVTGRKPFKPIQHYVKFHSNELELNRVIIEEFYNMHYLFTSTGNLRKDRMLEIINQLRLMLKACTIPHVFKEYKSNLVPTKVNKLISLLHDWENEQVAIGVRHVEVVDEYAAAIRKAFPDRPVFVITGNRVPLNKRKEITSDPLRKATNGILICTQQSLSSSVNIGYIDKIIIPELYWNDPAMSQFWSRFIRFNSKNPNKEVHFITYQESIECNLLGLIMAKQKLNLFMKDQVVNDDEMYEKYGVDFNLLDSLFRKEKDHLGNVNIRWGKQNIV